MLTRENTVTLHGVIHYLAAVINFMVNVLTDDVVTEQAILKWYNDAHVAKGKRVFLSQMKRMVDWLMTAEEESDTEETVTA